MFSVRLEMRVSGTLAGASAVHDPPKTLIIICFYEHFAFLLQSGGIAAEGTTNNNLGEKS